MKETYMNIQIRSNDFSLSESIKSMVQSQLLDRLRRYNDMVKSIYVVFSDINGPKGGNDKKCLIRISTKKKDITVVDTGADLYFLIMTLSKKIINNLRKVKGKLNEKRSKKHFTFLAEQ